MPSSSASGSWTDLERHQFEEGVIQFGWGKWVEISECIPSRRKDQIKSHAQKFSIHRKEEYAELLRQHAARMEEGNCGRKKTNKAVAVAATASEPVMRSVRRPSRSSRRVAATKSAAPTPVKVRRASKTSIESVATVAPKPVLAKAKNLSKATAKKPKLGATLKKFFTKSDTPKEPKLCADLSSTDNSSKTSDMECEILPTKVDYAGMESELCAQLMQLESPTKSDVADTGEVKADVKAETRDSISSFPSVVSPSASIKSITGSVLSLDYLDALEDDPKSIDIDSFALALADDILDIKLEEDHMIPDNVDIVEDNSDVSIEQQMRSRALMHLRLQVQPNEGALDEITTLLESPPDFPTSEGKSTVMRQRIIKLATEASDVGWWRESEKLIPEGVRKAHLEHLVALTFAVLQADAWKRTSEDVPPGQMQFNAQDDIRHICQLFTGIWNRVNHSLERDSYALFGAGVDQLERSYAMKKMLRMFDSIPCN
mmetsp:Transcript_26688/g.41871  ORF Transcript_26688/g.41871 Transcript_26688/m.41871 type:complete len:487 (-) Transcript_26688:346-1806(-)|eukprot:CAMPEP_0201713234 /NCGR_PEP_ID=MMETSP0593-20130828/148_1 /ASSEMBLY_ACC=CAM_ASM_000672 /TAXON_ID=267983 /ORGANISM="Skeletonema japonicum, Strain CCMP2506" /LENGTH=486 /DNA_ID=CAMNT_0048202351 /DNA_START=56 /DNA_END=1516 /DNA_ORIENTATION=+